VVNKPTTVYRWCRKDRGSCTWRDSQRFVSGNNKVSVSSR